MDMGVGGVDSRPTCVMIRLTNPGQPQEVAVCNMCHQKNRHLLYMLKTQVGIKVCLPPPPFTVRTS